jgi:hypothetical protein
MTNFYTEISGTNALGTHITIVKGGKVTPEVAISIAKGAGIRSKVLLTYRTTEDPHYSHSAELDIKLLRSK